MLTVNIILLAKKQKQRSDGTYPVVLRITHQRKRNYISLNKTCLDSQWNGNTSQFRRNYPDHKAENDLLLSKQSTANDIIRNLERDGIPFSFSTFKAKFLNQNTKISLSDFIQDHIKALEKEGRFGTALPYKSTLSHLHSHSRKKQLKFVEITYTFLKKFEGWLRTERKNKDITISYYMRTIRAALNKAIKAGHMKQNNYPFKEYTLAHLKTDTAKRAIDKSKVKEIEALILEEGTPLQFAKHIFLFSYYTRGMNFVDVAKLTADNIQGERLVYIRSKTGKVFNIALHEKAKKIIDYHKQTSTKDSIYLFPIFKESVHVNDKQKYNRRKKALRAVNRNLKQIAAMTGMENLNLTSYVSRHTYATVLKRSGKSITLISEALGHQDEKTTQIYLKQFEHSELDQADKDIL